MSSPGATGATPTPAQQPILDQEALAPAKELKDRQVAPTETTQTTAVMEAALKALEPPKTSHEASTGTKPTENRTNHPSTNDSKVSLVAKHQELAKPKEPEKPHDKELSLQRDGHKEDIREGWLDLSDVEDMGLSQLFQGEGEVEGQVVHTSYDSSAPISDRAQKKASIEQMRLDKAAEHAQIRADRMQRKLDIESVQETATTFGLESLKVTEITTGDKEIIDREAYTQVYNSDKIAYATIDTNQDTVSIRKVDPASAKDSEARINHETKTIIVTKEALGDLLPEQYKARLVDKGIVDDSYDILLATRFVKEGIKESFNHSVEFYTTLKQSQQTVDAFHLPSAYDSKVGPGVTAQFQVTQKTKASSYDVHATAISSDKSTSLRSEKDIQKFEETARDREHKIKELKEERRLMAEKKYEFEKAYWERHQAARAA